MKRLFIWSILGLVVLLLAFTACQTMSSGPLVPRLELDSPEDMTLQDKEFQITGRVESSSELEHVTVYCYQMNGWGGTNSAVADISGVGPYQFSAELTATAGDLTVLWAETRNKKGFIDKTTHRIVKITNEFIYITNTNQDPTNVNTNTNVITNDTTRPILSISAPSQYQQVASSYTISGTVSDSESAIASVKVKLDGGTYLSANLSGAQWSKSMTVSEGYHTNYAYAVDTAGNSSITQSLVVQYVAGIPSVQITYPAPNAVLADSALAVEGSASVSGATISLVELKLNSAAFTPVSGTSAWTTNLNLSEGANTLIARAIADNDKTNEGGSITVTLDTIDPILSIDSPTNNHEQESGSLTVSGTASDGGSGVKNVFVKVDSGSYQAVSGTSSWSKSLSLSVASHSISAYAKDNAGNCSATNTIAVAITGVPQPVIPDVFADPAGAQVSSSPTTVTLKVTNTYTVARWTTNGSDPASGGNSFSHNDSIDIILSEGDSVTLKLYAESADGSDSESYTFSWPSGDSSRPYYTNPTLGQYVSGGITVDGQNTSGEWTDSMIIALDVANDDPRSLGDNWTMHETPWDFTHLYAAWDDTHLYLAWQYVNVTDIVDPANFGSTGSALTTELINWVVFDTKSGEGCAYDMWGKNNGDPYWTGSDVPDAQFYYASNLWMSYISIASNGTFPVDDGDNYYKSGDTAGISIAGDNVLVPSTLYGTNDVDYIGNPADLVDYSGHDSSKDTFYEIAIPFSALYHSDDSITIDRSYIENTGIGVMLGQGATSCLDTIPHDDATLDTPGVEAWNSPLEWSDTDSFTVPFARIGHM